MFLFFYFLYCALFFQLSNAQNCNRFCEVTFQGFYNIIKEDNVILVNPQFCTHLIITWKDSTLNYSKLEKAYAHLQNYDIPSKTKILFSLEKSYKQLVKADYSFDEKVLKAFKKFDGCYINWQDDAFSLDYKLDVNTYIKHIRNLIGNKTIVVTVGAENTFNGWIDYGIFNENIDFVTLQFTQGLMDIHTQNYLPSRQLELREPREKIEARYLANKWIKNGFPKNKLLIFTKVNDYMQEPRVKTIWSSLNKFGGILLHGIQNFKNPEFKYNEMIDNAKKFKKVQICDSDTKTAELTFSCYISMEENANFKSNETEKYQKCDRIILQKAFVDSENNVIVPEKNFENVIKKFQNFDINETTLILSFYFNDSLILTDNVKQITSNIINFINLHNLDGIELNFDDTVNFKNIQEIFITINEMANIQIGLQLNIFKINEEFIETINEVEWVTHKINSLSDASLAIYYQWNKLHENYGLNLSKVVIKFSPGIWQQNAAWPFPSMHEKWHYLEKENPENDIILNRKYLCLNQTLNANLPTPDEYLNLPMIITIREDLESRKKAMQPYENEKWFIVNFFLMGQKYSTDLYYLRYETKETIEYKIKIAAKHGFGGIALDSINNDDIDEICGNSVFDIMANIIASSKLCRKIIRSNNHQK